MGLCREKIRRIKAHLATATIKKRCCEYISNNSRAKENLPSLWDVAGGWSLFPAIKG